LRIGDVGAEQEPPHVPVAKAVDGDFAAQIASGARRGSWEPRRRAR
jgi:hypothetical protein